VPYHFLDSDLHRQVGICQDWWLKPTYRFRGPDKTPDSTWTASRSATYSLFDRRFRGWWMLDSQYPPCCKALLPTGRIALEFSEDFEAAALSSQPFVTFYHPVWSWVCLRPRVVLWDLPEIKFKQNAEELSRGTPTKNKQILAGSSDHNIMIKIVYIVCWSIVYIFCQQTRVSSAMLCHFSLMMIADCHHRAGLRPWVGIAVHWLRRKLKLVRSNATDSSASWAEWNTQQNTAASNSVFSDLSIFANLFLVQSGLSEKWWEKKHVGLWSSLWSRESRVYGHHPLERCCFNASLQSWNMFATATQKDLTLSVLLLKKFGKTMVKLWRSSCFSLRSMCSQTSTASRCLSGASRRGNQWYSGRSSCYL